MRRAVILLAALALAGCGGKQVATRLPTTPCGTDNGRGCAPPSRRMDLVRPSFSHPTRITNPLFPISSLRSAVLLGHVEDKPFRSETTLLPGTTTVVWNGRPIEALVSQYMAYVGGRIDEVALDRYAQADDGSVWYLGEDVFDYRNGAIAVTEGTWLAGREGPAAMIMPARPNVGDVYRTENVPGIVFEEVEVKSVGATVAGPHGAVPGAIVARELHSDGTHEDKLFAPGYGEFRTAGGGDLEALALAVPADGLTAPVPAALNTLVIGATAILESTRIQEWDDVGATLRRVEAASKSILNGAPPLIASRLKDDLGTLQEAVRARRPAVISQAAIDVGRSALDLELRHRPVAAVDADRFALWTQQLRVDATAGDLAGVTGDVAVLEWVRGRFAFTLRPAVRRALDGGLRDLRGAATAKNLPAAADHAARLAALLRRG